MTFNDSPIVIGYKSAYLKSGIQSPIVWDYIRFPHVIITGATGSGKTYAVKLLLGRISKNIPNAVVFVCDYKADDFNFLFGCKNYFAFDDCKTGLKRFFNLFQARQQGEDKSRDFALLVFDEWASFLNNSDKKQADERIKMLSTLLMLGRSFNVHVIISQQRADAKYFDGARNNFNVIIGMGNLDRESRTMLFSGYDKEEMPPVTGIGEGYILINGAELMPITIPKVSNQIKLEYFIAKAVNK